MTSRLICYVIDSLSGVKSFSEVAKETNLSVSTVIRIFDHVTFKTPVLPEIIAIDEFKGNTGGEKFSICFYEKSAATYYAATDSYYSFSFYGFLPPTIDKEPKIKNVIYNKEHTPKA